MKPSLQPFLLCLFVCCVVPRAVLAVEPNVSIDARSKTQAASPDISCVQIPDSYQTVGPFTVQELEAESVGKASAEWKEFLRQMRKGDALLMYDEGCCTGIIIVRKGCIVDWFQLSNR